MSKELTLEEWREVAKKAKEVHDVNHEFFLILREKFSKTIWEKKWFASSKAIGKLRNHLDTIVCGKFLELSNEVVTRIFYANKDNEQSS